MQQQLLASLIQDTRMNFTNQIIRQIAHTCSSMPMPNYPKVGVVTSVCHLPQTLNIKQVRHGAQPKGGRQ